MRWLVPTEIGARMDKWWTGVTQCVTVYCVKRAGLLEGPWWHLSTIEIAYNGHVSVRTGPWSNGRKLPSFIWGRWQQDGKKAGQQSQFYALANVLLRNMDPRMGTWQRVQGIALAFKFPRSLSNWASMGFTSDTWRTDLTTCRNERICC